MFKKKKESCKKNHDNSRPHTATATMKPTQQLRFERLPYPLLQPWPDALQTLGLQVHVSGLLAVADSPPMIRSKKPCRPGFGSNGKLLLLPRNDEDSGISEKKCIDLGGRGTIWTKDINVIYVHFLSYQY